MERTVSRTAKALAEFGQFSVRLGRPASFRYIQPGERPYAINPVRIPGGFEIRSFEIGIAQGSLSDELGVVARADICRYGCARGILETQQPVVPGDGAPIIRHPGVHGRLGAEVIDLFTERVQAVLE